MKISKLISTVFLITSIITIFIFGMIFYLYINTDTKTLSALKDALTTTSGFLSGITTLAAAYIASKLFIDWKEQPKLNILHEMLDLTREMQIQFYELKDQNPHSNEDQNDQDFFQLRNKIFKDIGHLMYLDKKYKSLLRRNEKIKSIFSIFKNTNKTNVDYLQYILAKITIYYFVLKKENDTKENTQSFHEAMKFFSNAYFIDMTLKDEHGEYILIADLGEELDDLISGIYEDIEKKIV